MGRRNQSETEQVCVGDCSPAWVHLRPSFVGNLLLNPLQLWVLGADLNHEVTQHKGTQLLHKWAVSYPELGTEDSAERTRHPVGDQGTEPPDQPERHPALPTASAFGWSPVSCSCHGNNPSRATREASGREAGDSEPSTRAAGVSSGGFLKHSQLGGCCPRRPVQHRGPRVPHLDSRPWDGGGTTGRDRLLRRAGSPGRTERGRQCCHHQPGLPFWLVGDSGPAGRCGCAEASLSLSSRPTAIPAPLVAAELPLWSPSGGRLPRFGTRSHCWPLLKPSPALPRAGQSPPRWPGWPCSILTSVS
ncbi:uncharacterized protein [Equus przewalskii]|uniref:Uncharacterized protein n=1 Tax=Equus przewalskii TaxID=9798 RepID=A0ABM4M5A0_EQUPR